jgi:hypothetical protein
MNRNLIIAVFFIAAVAAAVLYGASQIAPAPAGEVATSTPQGAAATSTATSTPAKKLGPRTITTPYTVYLGYATEFGTSSPEVLQKEVAKVVVGYEWEALPDSAMFDSITIPMFDPNEGHDYKVHVWDREADRYILLGEYEAGRPVEFPREDLNGPRRFKVLGIDPGLRLCPGDRSFTWSFRFTFPVSWGVIRTPITQDLLVLPPETCRMRQHPLNS